jgi:hypothetical protein
VTLVDANDSVHAAAYMGEQPFGDFKTHAQAREMFVANVRRNE